jgi:hypothetical protein
MLAQGENVPLRPFMSLKLMIRSSGIHNSVNTNTTVLARNITIGLAQA